MLDFEVFQLENYWGGRWHRRVAVKHPEEVLKAPRLCTTLVRKFVEIDTEERVVGVLVDKGLELVRRYIKVKTLVRVDYSDDLVED